MYDEIKDAQALAILTKMFPDTSIEQLKKNIAIGKLEALADECMQRHTGNNFDWDYNFNYPGGINYGG